MWPFKRKPIVFAESTLMGRLLAKRASFKNSEFKVTASHISHHSGDMLGIPETLDNLALDLIELDEAASDADKLLLFEAAVKALNRHDEMSDGIDTVNREDLCMLIDQWSQMVGLEPDNYGNGEGIASEWRDW